MRLIDADKFKENILSGLYIYCQENKEDIARAIDDEPTFKTFTLADIEEQYRKGLEKGLSAWETERPQGEWIVNYTSQFINPGRHCSLCGKIVEFSENYCPQCGAKMEVKKSDYKMKDMSGELPYEE